MPSPRPSGMPVFKQMAILLAGSSLAAFALWWQQGENRLALDYTWGDHVEQSAREKGMITASLDEAKIIVDSFSHIVLDARKTVDFEAGHLPGAMSLPLLEFDAAFGGIAPLLTPDQPVMVYCSGKECDESIKLGEILIEAGYTNVTLFAGGMIAWQEAGFEVQR
ncbi:MAG: rhodanese-like domain-containing protein [Kiritimatiellia bacterium]